VERHISCSLLPPESEQSLKTELHTFLICLLITELKNVLLKSKEMLLRFQRDHRGPMSQAVLSSIGYFRWLTGLDIRRQALCSGLSHSLLDQARPSEKYQIRSWHWELPPRYMYWMGRVIIFGSSFHLWACARARNLNRIESVLEILFWHKTVEKSHNVKITRRFSTLRYRNIAVRQKDAENILRYTACLFVTTGSCRFSFTVLNSKYEYINKRTKFVNFKKNGYWVQVVYILPVLIPLSHTTTTQH
jgi:hypothetical protein